jgi:hypothetical protein
LSIIREEVVAVVVAGFELRVRGRRGIWGFRHF